MLSDLIFLVGILSQRPLGESGAAISKRKLCSPSIEFTVNLGGYIAVWTGVLENTVSFHFLCRQSRYTGSYQGHFHETLSSVPLLRSLFISFQPDLHETNFSLEANFFAMNMRIYLSNFRSLQCQKFVCELAANIEKEYSGCSQSAVIRKLKISKLIY